MGVLIFIVLVVFAMWIIAEAQADSSRQKDPQQASPLSTGTGIPINTNQDDLSSAVGADYTQLRHYLAKQIWQVADYETMKHLLCIAGGSALGRGCLQSKDFVQIPSTDLTTIDHLWVKYSGGKFGFSVQKNIYFQCAKGLNLNLESNRRLAFSKFSHRVGWRVNNDEYADYITYTDLRSDINAPAGHLPGRLDLTAHPLSNNPLSSNHSLLLGSDVRIAFFFYISRCGL